MQYFDVAKILTTHGLNGEVKVNVITDFPEDLSNNFGCFNLMK